MAADDKPQILNATRFMLDALQESGAGVQVITPFGSIERYFSALTHDQITSCLSSLGITLTATVSTTADLTSVGAQPARTTETDTASSGDNTPSSSPEPLQLRTDFVEWANTPEPEIPSTVLRGAIPVGPNEAKLKELKPGAILTLTSGETMTIHINYPRERHFSAYNSDGVRRSVSYDDVNGWYTE